MNLGKREQIVILVVSGILAIFLLHMFVFRPRAAEYGVNYRNFDTNLQTLQGLELPTGPSELREFEVETESLKVEFDESISSLGLGMPDAFKLKTAADYPDEFPEDQVRNRLAKEEKRDRDRKLQYAEQMDLIYEQLKRLLEFDNRRGGQRSRNSETGHVTDMTFMHDLQNMGFGWKLPVSLPPDATAGRLWDTLRQIEVSQTAAKNTIGNRTIYEELRGDYRTRLAADLGIDIDAFYRDGTAETSLAAKGQFVPLIHKTVFAILIEDELARASAPAGEAPYTRERIHAVLEIFYPFSPMVDAAGAELSPPINEAYFIYEHLRHLIGALEVAVATEVSQVYRVDLGEPSYLRALWTINQRTSVTTPTPPAISSSTPAPTPVPTAGYVFPLPPGKTPGPQGYRVGPIAAPRDAVADDADFSYDVGYVVPQKLYVVAQNRIGFNFVYEVLRRNPMAELDDLSIRTVDPNSVEAVEALFEATFLGVPYIFALEPGWKPPEWSGL